MWKAAESLLFIICASTLHYFVLPPRWPRYPPFGRSSLSPPFHRTGLPPPRPPIVAIAPHAKLFPMKFVFIRNLVYIKKGFFSALLTALSEQETSEMGDGISSLGTSAAVADATAATTPGLLYPKMEMCDNPIFVRYKHTNGTQETTDRTSSIGYNSRKEAEKKLKGGDRFTFGVRLVFISQTQRKHIILKDDFGCMFEN